MGNGVGVGTGSGATGSGAGDGAGSGAGSRLGSEAGSRAVSSGRGASGAGGGVGRGTNRETRRSSAGTEAGGDCTAASAAEGIILNRLTKPDDSPACFVHQSTDAFGFDGLGGDGGGDGGGLLGSFNGDTEFLLPPAGANQAAASGGHREVVCRERAAAEASGSQRGALEHPGGGHGRERGRSKGEGARGGSPALRESTRECGAAAPLARAGSAGGV